MRSFSKVAITAVAAAIAFTVPATAASAAPFDLGLGSLGSLSSIFPQPEPADPCETVGASEGTPKVTASQLTCLDAAGQKITVTGSGFSGANFGVYVGLVQDNQHSVNDATLWSGTQWVKAAQIVDGSWTAELDIKAVYGDKVASDCLVNSCSIYTMSAHGNPDRTQDTKTPVSFQVK